MIDNNQNERIPMLALRGISAFPDMLLNFDVERQISVAALEKAMNLDRRIFLLAQRDLNVEDPAIEDLYVIGTICFVKQILRMPGGGVRVMVEGKNRARLVKVLSSHPYFDVEVAKIIEVEPSRLGDQAEALIRQTQALLERYSELAPSVSPDLLASIMDLDSAGYIADYVAQNIYMKHSKKQEILDEPRPIRRIEKLNNILLGEIEVLEIEMQLRKKTSDRMMKNQREHILREQMKTIQYELGLGMNDDAFSDIDEYREQILALKAPPDVEEKLLKEVSRLSKQSYASSEASVIRTYLDTCLALPWNKTSKERADVNKTRAILDADHYGLEKVKQRIVEFVAVRQFAPDTKGGILCLVGPPGTGKTSIGMSIAKALNRNLARISLGGVHDEAEIRGHRKTYVGAMPGRIIAAVNQAGTKNPLLLLDEIDKLGSDYRGDPSAALLEALDPEQNHSFRDHYLELPFDLSDTIFITTANNKSTIPRPLLDRMEVIELSSYTDEEKVQIAKNHLLPKQKKKHGLKSRQLSISDATIRDIIAGYTRESGVRMLERELATICRKTALKFIDEGKKSLTVKSSMLDEFLGVKKYKNEGLRASDEVGLVRGLAWTSVGGEILDVEVNVMDGTGKLELTGNLGDVMKESARAGLSYIRSRAKQLNIDPEFYKNKDIHIHFPEGAVPKDGPSAGITVTLAVISALTGAPVRRDIAMTGEITLRGRILPIGGLKEKTMAALRSGIKTVIIPQENERDLEEIDPLVRNALSFITTDHIDKILDCALDLKAIHVIGAHEVPIVPEINEKPEDNRPRLH
ncbi:MAG: endopeptidase La [Clostridiales bacterium]|nr:endopeptidase La [Clostridiales bacterium]